MGDEHDYIDLKSDSFCLLWKTLREYQRARCASSYARAVLLESPWVKPDWIGDLLEAAGQAPARAIAPALSTDQISSGTELVKAVLLKWDWPGKPRFQLELDDSYVEELLANLDAHAVSFAVDNRPVDRWTLQEGGYWSGSRILRCEPQSGSSQPNLSPSILTISTAPGQPIAEMDLGSLGLNESLLIFDLRSGYPVREKSDLNTAKEYALICDQDLEVRGCTQSVAVGLRRAYRLTSNWPTDLKILSEGDWRQLELPINDN